MALCVAAALNWGGIPSCGFAASRKAIYLFVWRRIQGGERRLDTAGAAVTEVKTSHVSTLVWRPVCQVPVLSPLRQLHQQQAGEQLILLLPSTSTNPHRCCNRSSRESHPVFQRVNPSVHHDHAKQETASGTCVFLCVCLGFAWSNIHVNISRMFPLFTSFVRSLWPVSHWTNIRVS